MSLQAVPVLPTPSASTFMGTVRVHFRLSMHVSSVKTSVHGWDGRLSARAISKVCCIQKERRRRLKMQLQGMQEFVFSERRTGQDNESRC